MEIKGFFERTFESKVALAEMLVGGTVAELGRLVPARTMSVLRRVEVGYA